MKMCRSFRICMAHEQCGKLPSLASTATSTLAEVKFKSSFLQPPTHPPIYNFSFDQYKKEKGRFCFFTVKEVSALSSF